MSSSSPEFWARWLIIPVTDCVSPSPDCDLHGGGDPAYHHPPTPGLGGLAVPSGWLVTGSEPHTRPGDTEHPPRTTHPAAQTELWPRVTSGGPRRGLGTPGLPGTGERALVPVASLPRHSPAGPDRGLRLPEGHGLRAKQVHCTRTRRSCPSKRVRPRVQAPEPHGLGSNPSPTRCRLCGLRYVTSPPCTSISSPTSGKELRLVQRQERGRQGVATGEATRRAGA